MVKISISKIRPFTRRIKGWNKKNLIGCEVGVRHGYNAKNMLKHLDIEKLYLVDINFLKHVKNLKAVRIEGRSTEVYDQIPNNLDFVYIDANHSYEDVFAEISAYYPKVKKGGIIGGHDFHGKYGVPFAVCEYCRKHDLKLDGREGDWWIMK